MSTKRNRELAKERERREEMLDKTIADSFPASDPPSSNPAPAPVSDTDSSALEDAA